MGIPFYFASLIKSHRGITDAVKRDAPKEVDVLGVDFNCLIHRYLKDDNPVQSVVEAFDYILKNVCRAKIVIIALDGLVPYAKIVQQRYRRMRIKDEAQTGTFDRNQISPGTPYMIELENAMAAKFPHAILSRTSESGEGEHKLMLELDRIPQSHRQTICIYGLDADLILICLQNRELSKNGGMTLLRESAEFNDPSLKAAEFATLDIWGLAREIPLELSQYIALSIMCFGNDFMPNLGMFSLREDGYDRAMHLYTEAGKPDLYTPKGRSKFLKLAASREMGVYKERINLRKRPEEKGVLGRDQSQFSRKYGLHVLDGVYNMKPVVEAFWKTFHWSMDYFIESSPINWDWVYPYADAPLVSDIVKYTETNSIPESPLTFTVVDQLQFIMPKTSLRKSRKLVKYPDELHSETRNPWMKRHDWEMKPRISLPWNPATSLTKIALI
jgi:5'-3' exonuclease